ncbi:unnamed protein product [Allacma fusca]|uniref:Uncharacterized protein n=1 Tax=Allacma fusca TaxID=39272 RepID=A0A8J2PTQ9_9HEXA|nr:unnamed protein product [Allacma fusca]
MKNQIIIITFVALCCLNKAVVSGAQNGGVNRNSEAVRFLNRINAIAFLASQNGGIARNTGVTRLNLPPITSLRTIEEQRNALESMLRLIKFITGVDLEKILKQLQTTIDGSIAVIQSTVEDVEKLLSSANIVEIIVQNFNFIIEQSAFISGQGVEKVLNVLLWILKVSDIPLPLQAVVLFIAIVTTSIPAFLQGLVASVLEVTEIVSTITDPVKFFGESDFGAPYLKSSFISSHFFRSQYHYLCKLSHPDAASTVTYNSCRFSVIIFLIKTNRDSRLNEPTVVLWFYLGYTHFPSNGVISCPPQDNGVLPNQSTNTTIIYTTTLDGKISSGVPPPIEVPSIGPNPAEQVRRLLWWSSIYGGDVAYFAIGDGDELISLATKCKVKCEFTTNKTLLESSHGVIFHGWGEDLPTENVVIGDTNVTVPKGAPPDILSYQPADDINYIQLANRTKIAAWMVSNCDDAPSQRNKLEEQRNSFERMLRLIKFITGVDLEKCLKQLQSTIDGSIAVIQSTVEDVEKLLSSASVVEIIAKNKT